jgi:hypothetical protein
VSNKKSVHMYPTLRCNGKCSYCSNIAPGTKGICQYQERLPGHWIKLMRQLEGWDMYFTGGEIFLFQGVTEILENIPKFAKVYTNATLFTDTILGKIDPETIFFRCSYHPKIGPIEQFIDRLEVLKKRDIPFQVFMVDVPEDKAVDNKIRFRDSGFEIGIDYDQRRHTHKRGRVKCSIPTVFVGPDGTVFHCVSKMVRNKDGMGNAFDGYEIKESESVICDEPGACNPCDMASALQENV